MYQNSNAMSFCSIEPPAFPLPASTITRGAPLWFTGLALALTTTVFVVPLNDYWMISTTYDDQARIEVQHLEASARSGTLPRQIALGIMGLFGIAALVSRGGRVLQMRSILGMLCLAYLSWSVASCLWSDDFGLSLRRLLAFLCEVAAAVAIAKRTNPRQFVWIVFCCTFVWLGLGLLAELSLGTFRPWQQDYRFAGIFHPNIMGVNASMLALSSIYLAVGARRRNWLLFAVAALAFAFLLLTRSRTSLGALVVSLAALWFITGSITRQLVYASIVALAGASVLIAMGFGIFNVSADSIALGRSDHNMSSLTGRMPLWHELLEKHASASPFVGYGYGAFWTAERISELSKSQAWPVSHAHSGYIDLVLNLGFVGAALCVAAMVTAYMAASRRARQRPHAGFGFIAMVMAYGLTTNLTETYIGTTWFFSFFGVCAICYLLFSEERESRLLRPEAELRHILPRISILSRRATASEKCATPCEA